MEATVQMVDQSLVDAHLQRVNRFVDNVHKFQKKLDSLKSSSEMTQSQTTQQSIHQSAPQIAQPQMAQQTQQDQKVTADDIDIDAILSGVNLDTGMAI